jgi:hypothetical protein
MYKQIIRKKFLEKCSEQNVFYSYQLNALLGVIILYYYREYIENDFLRNLFRS